MSLHGWDRGLAVAALIAAVGVAVAQTPSGDYRSLVWIGVTVVCAIFAIYLLRPRQSEEDARLLAHRLTDTTARDIAFLRVASTAISFARTHSLNTRPFAPAGEDWAEETEEQANARASKLLALGLLETRGAEVQTSALGRALVALHDLQRQRGPKAGGA